MTAEVHEKTNTITKSPLKTKRSYIKKANSWRESNGKIYLNRKIDFEVPLSQIPDSVMNLYNTFVLSKTPVSMYSSNYIKTSMMILRQYKLIPNPKKKTECDNS